MLKQLLFVIEDGFTGFVSDKDNDLPVKFSSKEEAIKFAEYLKLDYLVVDDPEYAS